MNFIYNYTEEFQSDNTVDLLYTCIREQIGKSGACSRNFKTARKTPFEIFAFHCINTCYIKDVYQRVSTRSDFAMIHSPNSCHGDERPPESFCNTSNKIGWKFLRIIL